MKFQLLPLGARFEFEAKVYVKTGPLTATDAEGGQRMIPRFAVLKALDAPAAPSQPAGRKLDEAAVLAAFDAAMAAFLADCLRLRPDTGPDAGQTLRAELATARARFMAELAERAGGA